MAIFTLPLVISVLKPHAIDLALLRARKLNPGWLCKPLLSLRNFNGASVSAISTSAIQEHSSTDPNRGPQKASVHTFQQAIQRLQVFS